MSISSLLENLETNLPKDVTFKVYYLSTFENIASSLYRKIPGQQDDKTSCTKHFLVLTVKLPFNDNKDHNKEVIVYALEVYIYSTAQNITIFVSKADSTGYLDTLKLTKSIPSPIRTVSTTFLQYLITKYQRPGYKTIVSLFARAQDQYLFPRSVEYPGKHVQHDSGLIRWWCRVLNPIVETSQTDSKTAKGYILIPGLDKNETLSFVPNKVDNLWTVGHPLLEITTLVGTVAPRYLIPHFPDDPKARFLDELDGELIKCGDSNGHWRSIKTLDQFWEMMAFRQECSAGRLVGFIWIVISPKQYYVQNRSANNSTEAPKLVNDNKQEFNNDGPPKLYPHCKSLKNIQTLSPHLMNRTDTEKKLEQSSVNHQSKSSTSLKTLRQPHNRKKILTGRIITREPRYKMHNSNFPPLISSHIKQKTKYRKALQAPGQIIVNETIYNRIMELLLRLDFSKLELAISNSNRWIEEARYAGYGAMKEAWGQTVIGKKAVDACLNTASLSLNTLEPRMLQKRRKKANAEETPSENVG
ncbi:Histone acetyltransferase [Erysiphe necator]|nr:Histone acetyltransferase [Erysiphe necator]